MHYEIIVICREIIKDGWVVYACLAMGDVLGHEHLDTKELCWQQVKAMQ